MQRYAIVNSKWGDGIIIKSVGYGSYLISPLDKPLVEKYYYILNRDDLIFYTCRLCKCHNCHRFIKTRLRLYKCPTCKSCNITCYGE